MLEKIGTYFQHKKKLIYRQLQNELLLMCRMFIQGLVGLLVKIK